MPTVISVVSSLLATVKAAFVAYLGTTVGTFAYSTLVNYAFSRVVQAFSGRAGRGVGTSQKEREQNYRGGDNHEEVMIGKSKRGGVITMYQNATVNGVEYIYVCLIYNIFHPIKSIDNIYIGDKHEDHPDFSNVELAEYRISFGGQFVLCTGMVDDGQGGTRPDPMGCAGTELKDIVVTLEGVDYTYTVQDGDTAIIVRDAIKALLETNTNGLKIESADTEAQLNQLSLPVIKIIKTEGLKTDWDINVSIVSENIGVLATLTKKKGHAATEDYIRITRFLGDQTEANPLILSELKDNPTVLYSFDETHIGRDRAGAFFRFKKNFVKIKLGGIPQMLMEGQGHNRLLDPRTGQKGYSTNNAVVAYNAMLDEDIYAARFEDLPAHSWSAEANICDEQIQINDAGDTQNRYEFNGSYSYSWQNADIFAFIGRSCFGKFIINGHTVVMRVGTNRTPVYNITQDDIDGGFNYQSSTPLRGVSNRVTGTYISEKQGFGQTSYPTLNVNDGNKKKTTTINFDAEIEPFRAQRLSSIHLLSSFKTTPISFRLRPIGLNKSFSAGDYVTLENEYLGIKRNIMWEVISRKYDVDGFSDIILERRPSYVYDWNYKTATDVNNKIPARNTIVLDKLLEGIEI